MNYQVGIRHPDGETQIGIVELQNPTKTWIDVLETVKADLAKAYGEDHKSVVLVNVNPIKPKVKPVNNSPTDKLIA